MFWRKEILGRFCVAPIIDTGEYKNLKNLSRKNIEKSLLIVLAFFIIIFQISKRWDISGSPIEIPDVIIVLDIKDVPLTKQGVKKPKPLLPTVPIPVEDPAVPEDLTIEPTEVDFNLSLPDMPEGDGFFSIVQPRPIADVFPEYPDSEQKKGVTGEIELSLLVDETGIVKDVQVVKNSTNSKVCEQSAIRAAYQMRFMPAKQNKKYLAVWVRKKYKFGLD